MKAAEKVAILQALLERVQTNASTRRAAGNAASLASPAPRDRTAVSEAAAERPEPIGRSRADSLPAAGWDTWDDVAEATVTPLDPSAVEAAPEPIAFPAPLAAPRGAAPLREPLPAPRRDVLREPLPTPPLEPPPSAPLTPVPRAFPEPPRRARVPTPPRAQPALVLPTPPAPEMRTSPPHFWSEAGDRVSEPPADFERAIAHALETGQGKRVESVLPPPPSSEPAPLPAASLAPARSSAAIVARPLVIESLAEPDDEADLATGGGPLSRRRARPRLRAARRPRPRTRGAIAQLAWIAGGGVIVASLIGGALYLRSSRSRPEPHDAEPTSASSVAVSHEGSGAAPSPPSRAAEAEPASSSEPGKAPGPAAASDAGSDKGALIVESPASASVYVNGVLAGATNQRLEVACGLKHVRLARPELPPPGQSFPMWTTDGISVLIACGGVTKAAIASVAAP